MRVLVIGAGAREHALVEWLWRSHRNPEIYCAPGNPGIADMAVCVPIAVDDIHGLADWATDRAIDLTIVGPELPLTLGITDLFRSRALKIFGPSQKASQLEGSKIFTKLFCERHGIPTAPFTIVEDLETANKEIAKKTFPLVIKADGIAAGKGVVIAQNADQARQAVREMLVESRFGDAGKRVVLEDFMPGEEASFIVVADGVNAVDLPSSQDHKRVFDNDEGPNTGGMGAYAPAPIVTAELRKKVLKKIIQPTLRGMAEEGMPYQGFLYAGLMVGADGEPRLVEYNCRLGDPEAEVLLPLMASDPIDLFLRALEGRVSEFPPQQHAGYCVAVVLASDGYPGNFIKGHKIEGELRPKENGVAVFHAGTELKNDQLVTAGGRVLVVSARATELQLAIDQAYKCADKIGWTGRHMRRDIGRKGLARL